MVIVLEDDVSPWASFSFKLFYSLFSLSKSTQSITKALSKENKYVSFVPT